MMKRGWCAIDSMGYFWCYFGGIEEPDGQPMAIVSTHPEYYAATRPYSGAGPVLQKFATMQSAAAWCMVTILGG